MASDDAFRPWRSGCAFSLHTSQSASASAIVLGNRSFKCACLFSFLYYKVDLLFAACKKQVNFYFPPTDFSAGLGFSLPLMGNLCSSLCSCLGQEEHEVAQSDPMMDAEARALAAEAAQRRLAAYEQSA